MDTTQTEVLNSIVRHVFRIESITWGNTDYINTQQSLSIADQVRPNHYLAVYRGHLVNEDSAVAYDRLAEDLRPLNVTPLFRKKGEDQMIVLLNGTINPSPSDPRINLILFLLTTLSVLFAGILYAYEGPVTGDLSLILPHILSSLGPAIAFTASLLAILLAHEFGHYLVARYHKTAATLPYFIPLPISPLGTMGAVIVQKESHKNKRILLDIGIAGPLAGFLVTIPVLLIGLALSPVDTLPTMIPDGQEVMLEGNSILYLLAKFAVFRDWLPAPVDYNAIPEWMYWLRYYFTAHPIPFGGKDVIMHPVAWAGWAGLLVTGMNLIPAGQLDGGHILHGLLDRRAQVFLPIILVSLMLLGFVWSGWWLFAALIFFMGRTYAEPLDQITPLDNRRKVLAVIGLIIFILVFTPVPLRLL